MIDGEETKGRIDDATLLDFGGNHAETEVTALTSAFVRFGLFLSQVKRLSMDHDSDSGGGVRRPWRAIRPIGMEGSNRQIVPTSECLKISARAIIRMESSLAATSCVCGVNCSIVRPK